MGWVGFDKNMKGSFIHSRTFRSYNVAPQPLRSLRPSAWLSGSLCRCPRAERSTAVWASWYSPLERRSKRRCWSVGSRRRSLLFWCACLARRGDGSCRNLGSPIARRSPFRGWPRQPAAIPLVSWFQRSSKRENSTRDTVNFVWHADWYPYSVHASTSILLHSLQYTS